MCLYLCVHLKLHIGCGKDNYINFNHVSHISISSVHSFLCSKMNRIVWESPLSLSHYYASAAVHLGESACSHRAQQGGKGWQAQCSIDRSELPSKMKTVTSLTCEMSSVSIFCSLVHVKFNSF